MLVFVKALYFSLSYINFLDRILIYYIEHLTCVQIVSVRGKSEGEVQRKCLCVNPGRLARGEGGGFFVELNYHGSPDLATPDLATASIIRI